MGYKVISVDMDPNCECDYTCDVRRLPYKTLPTPGVIWASPPCTTYSYAAIWYRHRDSNGKAQTKDAKDADAILRHTFLIINHFMKENPNLKFCIENPRGYMQKMSQIEPLHRTTTSYNNFAFPICKPTDFFTNFPLELPECRRLETDLRICGSNMQEIRKRMKVKTGDDLTRLLYRIPPRLVKTIFEQVDSTKNTSRKRTSRKRTSRKRTSRKRTSRKRTSRKRTSRKRTSRKRPSRKRTSRKQPSRKRTSRKRTSRKRTSRKRPSRGALVANAPVANAPVTNAPRSI